MQSLSNDRLLNNLANTEINTEDDLVRAYSSTVTVAKKTAVDSLPTKKFKRYLKPY